MKRKIFMGLAFLFATLSGFAQTYVTIGKAGKVYDEANMKYVTLNQNNEEVNVVPGMVFRQTDKTPGWEMIEYSPGLRGYIPETMVASELKEPVAGNYKVANNPQQNFIVTLDGDQWTGTTDGKTFTGKRFNNVIVFFDNDKNRLYTLADPGTGGTVINYDNAVTKFF